MLCEGDFVLDCEISKKLKVISDDIRYRELLKVPIPEPKRRDPLLEQEMLSAIGDWQDKPLRVIITENEWTVENNVVGVAIFKYINTAVIVQTNDGKCKYVNTSFKQMLHATTYGATELYKIGSATEISCENALK